MDDRELLNKMVDAWEALPGGRYEGRLGLRKIDAWLREHMSPTINRARAHLGRKPPPGD